jgi:hypothetical protein
MKSNPKLKRQRCSISSTILTIMENLIFDKFKNAENYSHILFCGGVLNSYRYPEMIKNSVFQLLSEDNISQVDIKFSSDNIKDNVYSFYKGANFLSKLDNLEDTMISMQEYHENGKERLSLKFL